MKKCRVFTTCLGWSEVMFIFDNEIKFSDIKKNPQTHMLTRDDFIGTYEFDKKFIKFFEHSKIEDKYYFYRFSYQKDNLSQEKLEWKRVPEIEPEPKRKEHKDVSINDGQSDASSSLF